MPRPIQYEKQKVLDQAMEVFWTNGYEATSMDVLVDRTGLNRRSMYKLFGGKQGFFIRVLQNYLEQVTPAMTAPLIDKQGFDAIATFFKQFKCFDGNRGCLVTNTAVEKALFDREAKQLIAAFYDQLEQMFRERLEQAKNNNEIRSDIEIQAMAKQLLCMAQGLGVFGKVRESQDECKAIVDSMLQLLRA